MNFFTIVLLIFALLGLVDKILNNRWQLAGELDKGLATMGAMATTMIGIYCMGTTFAQKGGSVFAELGKISPIDPSIFIGCLLAPDIGGYPIALGVSSSVEIGYFSGIIVASCLGQLVGFQLPVLFPVIKKEEKPIMMHGFVLGILTVPFGLIVGGLILGLSFIDIVINAGIICVICFLLSFAFKKASHVTTKVLMATGNIIRMFCIILFAAVIIGLFIPGLAFVEMTTLYEALLVLLKMIIIVCGGMVFAKIVLNIFQKQISWLGKKLHTNSSSVIGLFLNIINSLPMISLYSQMDDNGRRINAAFSVSGAYLLGGQMAFIAAVGDTRMFCAYFLSKLTAGALAVIVSIFVNKKMDAAEKKQDPEGSVLES